MILTACLVEERRHNNQPYCLFSLARCVMGFRYTRRVAFRHLQL